MFVYLLPVLKVSYSGSKLPYQMVRMLVTVGGTELVLPKLLAVLGLVKRVMIVLLSLSLGDAEKVFTTVRF